VNPNTLSREHIMTSQRGPSQRSGLIDPADSILLVIDLQPGFLNKLTPERREAIVDHCRFIVEAAARFSVPVFATVEDPGKNGGTAERVHACFERGLAQRDKQVFGLCGQNDLREAILAQPKRTAVLIGMDTDVCVLHSAVGLLAEGFHTAIVSEATEAPGAARDQGLARAAALGVEIVGTRGLYYEWVRSLEGIALAEAAPRIVPPAGIVL
jgi:nicotinamidase-related amidase